MEKLTPAEWSRKMKQLRKLMTRKLENQQAEAYRRCKATFDLFAGETHLRVRESTKRSLEEKKLGDCLTEIEEGMDCDPFMQKKDVARALLLEAWSAVYDLVRQEIELHRHDREVLSHKTAPGSAFNDLADKIEELEAVAAQYNTKFALYRVVNHIERGFYKPPRTAAEQRRLGKKTFLALAGEKQAIRCVKESKGTKDLGQLLEEQQHGAATQVELATGAQPLHYASMKGQADQVKMLLEAKGNPNAQTLRGFTPLHLAYQSEHSECVDLLLQHGADVNIRSTLGKTPGQMKVGKSAALAPVHVKPFY